MKSARAFKDFFSFKLTFAEKAAALTSVVGALVLAFSFFVGAYSYRADKEAYLFEMQMHRARFVEAQVVLALAQARLSARVLAPFDALPPSKILGLERLPDGQEAFVASCKVVSQAAALPKTNRFWCVVFRDAQGNMMAAPYHEPPVQASESASEGTSYVVTPAGLVVQRSVDIRARTGDDVSNRDAVRVAFESQLKENTMKIAPQIDTIVSYREIENTNLIAFSEISTRTLMEPLYAVARIWFLVALTLIALGALLTFHLVRRMARNSTLAASHLVRMAQGEFNAPPPYTANDEFRILFEGIHFLARNLKMRDFRLSHVRDSLHGILAASNQLPVEASEAQLKEYAQSALTQILSHFHPSQMRIFLTENRTHTKALSSLVLSVPPDSANPVFVAEVDGVNEESLWPETKQTLKAFANSLADHFERRRAARTLALNERREAELQLASLIQASLVQFPSQIPNATLAWQYLPAGKLGGDWISAYYDAPSKRLRFFVADATGHGVVPAMVTAVVAGAARHFSLSPLTSSNFTSDQETESLKRFAVHLNGIVLEAGGGKIGLSLVMGSLACDSGLLTLLQFGHPFPLLFDVRSADSGSVSVVKPKGNDGLGTTRFPHPQAQDIQLQSGQGLFLYTDGLVENFQGRLTTRRIRKILASSVNCGDAVDAVVREYGSESGSNGVSSEQGHDDVALLALRWGG